MRKYTIHTIHTFLPCPPAPNPQGSGTVQEKPRLGIPSLSLPLSLFCQRGDATLLAYDFLRYRYLLPLYQVSC